MGRSPHPHRWDSRIWVELPGREYPFLLFQRCRPQGGQVKVEAVQGSEGRGLERRKSKRDPLLPAAFEAWDPTDPWIPFFC